MRHVLLGRLPVGRPGGPAAGRPAGAADPTAKRPIRCQEDSRPSRGGVESLIGRWCRMAGNNDGVVIEGARIRTPGELANRQNSSR